MQDSLIDFTEQEIEEIEDFKEFCKATSIAGKKVICFEVLSDILKKRRDITSFDRDTLLTVYKQLELYGNCWSQNPILDSRTLEQIIPKVKRIIKNQIVNR